MEIETRRDERVREKKEITREASSIVSERAWRGYEREREREWTYNGVEENEGETDRRTDREGE